MKSPHIKLRTVIQVTSIIFLALVHNAIAANQIDEATEQRILREQNRVIQNQQMAIEADQRKRESDIIERQSSSVAHRDSVKVGENQNFFDSKKTKEGCAVINSSDLINGTIPNNPPFISLFHNYLLAKSLHPEYLAQFDCAKKLEEQAIPLLALDYEPQEKLILQGDVNAQILHLHREIIRNLYQIVQVFRDKNDKITHVAGIRNGLLFENLGDQLLSWGGVMDSGTYLKFSSELSSNGKEEYFIPTKSYQKIKKYLSKLDQLEAAKNKSGKNTNPSFAVSYSAFVNALSIDSKKDHQFAWIDEIRQTPYFSFYDLINYLLHKDRDSQMMRWGVLLGYFYSYEFLHSNFVLIKAVNELGLAPKTILPLVEKSLKSGNKDFCAAVKNPEKPIAVDQLTQKQKKMLDVLVKYCPELSQIENSNNVKR